MKKWLSPFFLTMAMNAGASTEVVVFRDGTRMEVRSVELDGELALITGLDGKLLSVSRELVESDPSTIIDIRGWALDVALSVHRAADDYREKSPHDPTAATAAEALREGFASDRFVELAAEAFSERASSLDWSEILPQLESPLVQKMERLERAEASRFTRDECPPARIELVRRLDRATGTSDIALELQATMTASLLDGINSSLPVARKRAEGDVMSAVDRVRASIETRTREQILSSLVHTYEDVSDEELRQYVKFLESENGLALSQAILESLLVAISDASRRTNEFVGSRARSFGRTRI
jgi:hypothetical protein